MVRLVSLSIPVNKKGDVTAILDPLANKRVFHLVTLATDDTVQMTFKCRDKHLQDVLEELGNIGCGKWFGTVDAMIVAVSRPSISSVLSVEGKKREYKINTRMTIDEIDSIVDDGNHLTFNYMMQLTMASIMAGTGMVTNSSVSVLASMLVSPLMGPVLSMAFGMAVNDMAVIKRGLRNEIVGVTIGLVTGIVMGFFSSFLYPSDYRSDEMTSRGSALNLISGCIIAGASGVSVVIAVSMGGWNAVVGVAISISLLPPIVNASMCWTMALMYWIMYNADHDSYQYSMYGLISFCLFLINLFWMVVLAYLTFRYVKDVKPGVDRGTTFSDTSSEKATAVELSPVHELA